MNTQKRALMAIAFLLTGGCATSTPAPNNKVETQVEAPAQVDPAAPSTAATEKIAPFITNALAAEDRSQSDIALDVGRKPAQLMDLAAIKPGMKAGEIFAGGGYTAELLARIVGPDGEVYGVNSPWALERFAEKPWSERLSKPVMANVTRLDREFDTPFPEDLVDLDRVFSIMVYHDFIWMETDMVAHNQSIFNALKPGGIYLVSDHSAAEGTGLSEVQSLHRIEQSSAREQIEAVGFEFIEERDFLKNPEDLRDWSASPRAAGERRGTSDRFVMIFRKPNVSN